MKPLILIAKKEIVHGLNGRFAYLLVGLFASAFALSAFWSPGAANVLILGQADLRPLLSTIPLYLMVLIPALTMRCWSQERATGTHELLVTWPLADHHLVLGKFLGSYALVCAALLATLPLAFLVDQLGDLDWGPVLGAYCGASLLAACCLAICQFLGSFTRDPMTAFLVGLSTLAVGMFLPWDSLNLNHRYANIARGVLEVSDLLFYLILSALFLQLAIGAARVRRRYY